MGADGYIPSLCVSVFVLAHVCGGMCTAQNIFFGDVLFVSGKPVEPVVNTKCVNKDCGIKLVADRDTMRVEGLLFPRSPSPFLKHVHVPVIACTCYCICFGSVYMRTHKHTPVES